MTLVLRKEKRERVTTVTRWKSKYTAAPYLANTCRRVSGTRPLRIIIIDDIHLKHYNIMVRSTVPTRRVRSHRHKSKTFITDTVFVPAVGDGWRRGWLRKSRLGRDFCGCATRRLPVRGGTSLKYFCADRPAGLGRRQIRTTLPPPRLVDASKTGNVARKATAPTARRRRRDSQAGGAGRAHDPRTCVCTVC